MRITNHTDEKRDVVIFEVEIPRHDLHDLTPETSEMPDNIGMFTEAVSVTFTDECKDLVSYQALRLAWLIRSIENAQSPEPAVQKLLEASEENTEAKP